MTLPPPSVREHKGVGLRRAPRPWRLGSLRSGRPRGGVGGCARRRSDARPERGAPSALSTPAARRGPHQRGCRRCGADDPTLAQVWDHPSEQDCGLWLRCSLAAVATRPRPAGPDPDASAEAPGRQGSGADDPTLAQVWDHPSGQDCDPCGSHSSAARVWPQVAGLCWRLSGSCSSSISSIQHHRHVRSRTRTTTRTIRHRFRILPQAGAILPLHRAP